MTGLATCAAGGLTTTAAQRRLAANGPNELASRGRRGRMLEIARTIANPLALILLTAGTASALVGEVTNAVIIWVMVVFGASLDSWQTLRSERAVQRLQQQIAPTAVVLRDGSWTEIPRRELVVGDQFRLSAGDMVPADARIVEATDLHVQQAALTGESLPAEKRPSDCVVESPGPDAPELVYLGTSVVSGCASAVVFATAGNTAFGDIVARLAARPEETEFERGSRRFGMLILKAVMFLVLFMLVVNISLGRNAFESLLFSIALAVGLTPEFLPMITTVTLAQGAVEMARKHVIVKHLSAIQNLGSIDILCSDKTGTLTAGTMTLDATLDPLGQPSDRALAIAQLNSRFETGIKSPLDVAILERPLVLDGYTKVAEIPFDFERRRMSVVVAHAGRHEIITKGAPESVIADCRAYELSGEVHALDERTGTRCHEVFCELSQRGFRVLAVAYREIAVAARYGRDDEHDLVLVGFVTFADHLLEDTCESIAALRADGVTIKILTGDNELVSRCISEQAGLDVGRIVLGEEIEHLDTLALARVAEVTTMFARVSPAQKHRIIGALKASGHVVGFLGDGINDAPSLHAADVGISVAGATDIAREASDIVLLERRLAVLHAGILAGRRSFGNVLKYLLMGTSSNFGNMFSMAGASIFLPFLPMLPTQILLNNFLYDLAQVTIPTDRVDPAFTRKPQRWDIAIVRRFMLVLGPISSVFDFITFGALLLVFRFTEAQFHTGWFVESLATQALVLFVIRTAGRPWRDRPSTPLLVTTLVVVAVGIFLPFSPVATVLGLTPLPARYFAFVFAIVVVYLGIIEAVKPRLMARIGPLRGDSSTVRDSTAFGRRL